MASSKGNTRQIMLVLLMLVVGFFFFRHYFGGSLGRLPLDGVIVGEEKKLARRLKQLHVVHEEEAARRGVILELRTLSETLWREKRNAKQEVVDEFDKLARAASVMGVRIASPRESKFMGSSEIKQVEVTVSLTASMREITRLLNAIEKSSKHFHWSQCTLRPDNQKAPTKVRMTGRVRALVLSRDAEEFLSDKEKES
ncbi:MAG: hypothetical protein KAI66_00935 [Lentisphaeria bacterium]|nr:hypothetical protein [Lentisphaeria bacterium]